jgi:acyl-CoA synthetase (NDP forming)
MSQQQKSSTSQKRRQKSTSRTEAKTICAEYGISVNKFSLATTAKEAVEQQKNWLPIVLKIVPRHHPQIRRRRGKS